ncbi:MAG TPA: PASTA domain-containing protein, partial [Chloroflexota bacterium]|nr:PASTA domain-containing protein [Chloroflexota bacterium]
VTIGNPVVGHTVNTGATIIRQPDPTLPVGTEIVIETAKPGFDVSWDRRVTSGEQVLDEYHFTSHYLPSRNIVAVGTKGATATPTSTPSPTAVRLPGATSVPTGTPTSTDPASVELVRVPGLVGLLEVQAKPLIARAGLTTTFSNYQGPGDIPSETLKRVGIGSVLSQTPPSGALVPKGSQVFLAVRKS